MGITLSRVTTSHNLTPEYRSQDGSGTLGYHRFEDRSIILSRTTLIEVYTLSLISVFWAQAGAINTRLNPKGLQFIGYLFNDITVILNSI